MSKIANRAINKTEHFRYWLILCEHAPYQVSELPES
jgi:hypothetical protein